MFVSGLYLLLFILSAIALNRLVVIMSNRRGVYYAIMFTLITIVCLAYFSYSIAIDASMALVSNQFTYLDGTLIMMFFVFCIMDIVGVRIRNYVAAPWSMVGVFFLLIPFTAGHNGLFYKSYTYSTDYGAAHLQMEFGPWHTPFLVYIVINMLLPFLVVGVSFFYKKRISYKISLTLSILLALILLLYAVQQVVGLGFDLLPCGYVLIEYVVLRIIRHISLYDVNKIALDTREADKDYGCIVFDMKKRFVSANDTAKYYYPELGELGIDRDVNDETIRREFVDWISDDANNTKVLIRNDKKLLCSSRLYKVGKNNKPYGYVVELRDDTEQQNLIDKLNETNEDLVQTVEIANNANKAKSQFLANMSHEIRTPINAILGMNELAMRKCKDQELLEYMHDIENAGHNLMGIINDILDFSKIEAGKIDIINDTYDLSKVIKDVEDLIVIKARQKSLTLNVNVDSSLPYKLDGDEKRIRQIMVNLLNNAVKYTHDGSVTLDVSMNSKREKDFDLVIKVSDTGIGIKEEDVDKLFSSFSRLDEKKNKSIEGTGLGLAITGKLVKLMNGNISVKSVYGKGSEFLAIVPQNIVEDTPIGDYHDMYKSYENTEKEVVNLDATGKEILVIDDNLINLKIAEGLLETTNANVTICESGPESLDLMSKKHYDLILLDHMMPEMDGIEVLNEAKTREESLCRESVYIVLTANAINGVQEEYRQAGFDDYLSKPIDPNLFIKTIGKYI